MLFITVADSLNWFITNSVSAMHTPIHIVPQTIQYADDTIIIVEAHPRTLRVITMILATYESLSGLRINRSKSSFVPIAIPTNLVGVIRSILGCEEETMPIKYLGLPLSAKKPRREDFLPLIVAVETRVASWKSSFLSFGGRLTLIKSVLSAVPLHFMQALKIPKWIFQKIDRIRMNFLWKGNQPCKPINCLVNWELTCALKEEGGLGIIDLQTHNEALMTKWLWLFQSNSQSNWMAVLTHLYGIQQAADIGAETYHSFFLRDLKGMHSFYRAAVSCADDNFDIGWILGQSGRFCMSSAYRMLHLRGISCPFQSRLWSTKALPKVRMFLWVLIKNKLLTRVMLQRRGCQVADGCALCGGNMMETSRHLFWECSVS